jgi:hypothetical protein
MSFKGPLPEHLLNKMTKEQRTEVFGNSAAGFTAQEIMELACKKREKSMHEVFSQWLNLNGIRYRHDRMDKKTTGQVGWPDFTIVYGGKALLIEFKMPGNGLSPEQKECVDDLLNTGTAVVVCSTASDAIEFTRDFFNLNKRKT